MGDPESNQRDQVLDEISVGPVVAGMHKFILTTPPPNPALIRNEDLIGVTAILITCKFHDMFDRYCMIDKQRHNSIPLLLFV